MVCVVLCATVGYDVIVAWSDDQITLEDAIHQLKTDKVEYKVLDDLADSRSSTIWSKLKELNWKADGEARMKELLGKLEDSPTQQWEARFRLLRQVEEYKTGTYFQGHQGAPLWLARA
jgi:hypothetical protein